MFYAKKRKIKINADARNNTTSSFLLPKPPSSLQGSQRRTIVGFTSIDFESGDENDLLTLSIWIRSIGKTEYVSIVSRSTVTCQGLLKKNSSSSEDELLTQSVFISR